MRLNVPIKAILLSNYPSMTGSNGRVVVLNRGRYSDRAQTVIQLFIYLPLPHLLIKTGSPPAKVGYSAGLTGTCCRHSAILIRKRAPCWHAYILTSFTKFPADDQSFLSNCLCAKLKSCAWQPVIHSIHTYLFLNDLLL